MKQTKFVRINHEKTITESHTVNEILNLKCLHLRLTYRTISGEYFSISEDELIYTSSHSKYEGIDYILSNFILEEDYIRVSSLPPFIKLIVNQMNLKFVRVI